MGISTLRDLEAGLLRAGLDASTPAAIIENGGTHEMHVLAGTLSSFARDGQGRSRGGPALVLLGEVVDPAAGSSAARLRLAEPCSGA